MLGPSGNLLLIGGHLQTAIETSGSPSEALTKATLGGLKSFTEQTFLTGIQSAVNAISDPERYAKTYLPNLVASFVPTIVSDVARATDPKERKSKTTRERIQARIPIARKGLEPQIDILGRERKRVGNPLEVLIDPSRPSPDVGTPVTDELRRLMDEGFRVSPTKLGDRHGFKALSAEENADLWRLAGEITNDKLTSLFSNDTYQELPEDKKEKVIKKFVDTAKLNARVGTVIQLTLGLSGEELKTKLSELKKGKLLTRQVFNEYLKLR